MNRDEFIAKLKTEIEDFSAYWEIRSKADPGKFPPELPTISDWWEQFTIFIELGAGDEN